MQTIQTFLFVQYIIGIFFLSKYICGICTHDFLSGNYFRWQKAHKKYVCLSNNVYKFNKKGKP